MIDLFYPSKPVQLKEYYDISELLEVYFSDLMARNGKASNELLVKFDIDLSQHEFKKNQNKTTKRKKEPLVSDKEAEEFILKSVFNINFRLPEGLKVEIYKHASLETKQYQTS